jgi:glucose/arabinose dehydrogenase
MKYLKLCLPVAAFLLMSFALIHSKSKGKKYAEKYTPTIAFPNLPEIKYPVELTSALDGTDRIFVVAQRGVIHVFPNKTGVSATTVFLDITKKVKYGGEAGFLGLAFHPDYKTNGYFYVNYMRNDPSLETVIARYKVSASNPNVADPNSEEILLTYAQPYDNHNGGKLAFGNDKLLYIAAGDGGSWGDPHKNGQNKAALLGKILRIDVNKQLDGKKYAIPADNPFKGNKEGFREEIYAYGMRNPWRFNFDRTTGWLWAGDVGQNAVEEIDIIEKGANYGWNIAEGNQGYKSNKFDRSSFAFPIWTYDHGVEGSSITGGYVCRDKNLPGLSGKYIYGDYTSGKIWALTSNGKKAIQNELIANVTPGSLSSFGEDSKSNLYILNYGDGKIYKLLASQ